MITRSIAQQLTPADGRFWVEHRQQSVDGGCTWNTQLMLIVPREHVARNKMPVMITPYLVDRGHGEVQRLHS